MHPEWNSILRYTQYKLKRCSKKKCCKQCRYDKFKGTITKWPVQKITHSDTKTRTTSWRNRHLEKTIFLYTKRYQRTLTYMGLKYIFILRKLICLTKHSEHGFNNGFFGIKWSLFHRHQERFACAHIYVRWHLHHMTNVYQCTQRVRADMFTTLVRCTRSYMETLRKSERSVPL